LLVVYGSFIVGGTVYRGAITYLPKHLEDFVDKDFGGAFVTVALLMGAVGSSSAAASPSAGGWSASRRCSAWRRYRRCC
jgi:hypothetical protein